MKQGIHPTFYTDTKVTCASCGTTWTTSSTKQEIRVETCSNCHPFFTGEQGRPVAALEKAGIKEVGQFLARLNEGEQSVLSIEGFGRKSLIDLKKKLRALGYDIPEPAETPAA
jgi:large subunit ribosomal protein L31